MDIKGCSILLLTAYNQRREHERRLWAARRELKDVYLECGWDVEAKEQTTFRRGEFLEKRREYLRDAVGPLDGWPRGSG